MSKSNRARRKVPLAGAALAVLALAGCGTTTATHPATAPVSSPAPAAAPAARPASPVAIIKMAGAATTEVYGQVDISGDRYADGTLPGATVPGCSESWNTGPGGCLESVTVYTYATKTDQARYEQQNATPADGQVMISGDRFTLTVGGVSADGSTWIFPVSPAAIAVRVHGTVVEPS